MVNEILSLAAANPMTTALVIIVVATSGCVCAALVRDAIEQRQLAALQDKLAELERNRDRLKGQL